jgi:hypothetical protein
MERATLFDLQEFASTTGHLLARQRGDDRMFWIFAGAAVLLTPPLVLAVDRVGLGVVFSGLVVIMLLATIALQPIVALYVVAFSAILIEEDQPPYDIWTNHLPIFSWPARSALEGFVERPIGLLLIYAFVVLLARRLAQRQPALRVGALFWPLLCFLMCAVGGALHGLATGGSLKLVVVAFRPLWYLFLAYLLAVNLITERKQVRAFLWIVILGAGVKALQGIYVIIVDTHGLPAGHVAILSHEDSFFFISVLVLLILFGLYFRYRPQWRVALLLVPAYLISLVANDRRADYVAFLLGAGVVVLLILYIQPHVRTRLIVAGMVVSVLGVAYVVAFAQSSGTFAAPARSIVSVFSSNTGNAQLDSSDLYRTEENYDLLYTVQKNPLLGLGFGKPYAQPMPLSALLPEVADPTNVINFVPHNNIYWIFMALGPVGYFAMWYLFGAIAIKGCVLARQLRDPYLRLFAMFAVAVVFMEVTVAFADYQLFFYRNVFFVGLVVGILVVLPALDVSDGPADGVFRAGRAMDSSARQTLNDPDAPSERADGADPDGLLAPAWFMERSELP